MTQVFRTDFNKADAAAPLATVADINGGSGDDAMTAGGGFNLMSISSGRLMMFVGGGSVQANKSGLATGAAGATVRIVLRTPTTGGTVPFATLWTAAQASRVCVLGVNGSNQFVMRNAANSSVGGASTAWAANTWYAVEFTPTNSTGTYKISAYLIDTGDGTESLFWSTTQATGRADSAFDWVELGKSSGTVISGSYGFESLLVDNTVNTYLGPDNSPPTATITANQFVSAGGAAAASVIATDPDGGVLTYAWSVVAPSTATPTLTGSTTANVSFTAPGTPGLVTLQCVVTDDASSTVTVTTEVRIPVTGSSDIFPMALAALAGTFVNVGGVATTGGALADATNTTYLETPAAITGSEQSQRQRLTPCYPRNPMNLVVTLAVDTGTATALVRLREGAAGTIRDSWTQSVNSTPTDYTLAIDSTSLGNIVDTGYLIAEVGFTS